MNRIINSFKAIILIIIVLLSGFSLSLQSQSNKSDNPIPLASSGELKFGEISINTDKPGLYEKYELTFTLSGSWLNPFDPDQIKVDAMITDPNGKMLSVPGFFYQDYVVSSPRTIEKTGDPIWKVRFSPSQSGDYTVEIRAVNKGKETVSPRLNFKAVDYNVRHGYLKISKSNPQYFEFDDGTPFFAVAVDNAVSNYFSYMRYYPRFASAGGNYNRLFIMSGDLDLGEEYRQNSGPDRGLGKINLDAAWKLDKVIEAGELLGIYHQMCMTNQYNFNLGWKYNSFNKENGGILESPKDYYTSEESMKILEKRFRYIIARWGYSTAVFSWNLWNEYSAQPGFDIPPAVAWHKRMADYISGIDPFNHVIHTNDGRLNGVDEISGMPEMEIVSTNTYGIKNIAALSETWTQKFITKFNKPYMLAEYGIGHSNLPPGGYGEVDPEKRMVHDGIWGPLVGGSAGTGMPWEWQWLDNNIVLTFYKAVSKIVDGVPFSKREWKPVGVASLNFKPPRKMHYSDVIIEGWNPTGNYGMPEESSDHKIFRITSDGKVEMNELLHSPLVDTTGKKKSRSVPSVTFSVNYPEEGEFVVYASDIRNTEPSVKLKVILDDREVLIRELPPKPYLQYFPVKVTKGLHTIAVSNGGGGSFQTAFELKNYKPADGPDLEVRGIKCNDYIILWIKNQKYTLLHELAGIEFIKQPAGLLELKDIPDGTWIAEWVNTINSSTVKTELVEGKGSKLILNTPEINESIAVKIFKVR